jgi:superfamily II DNA/RNA helicase
MENKNIVIFCNRKKDITSLYTDLKKRNISSIMLHGDLIQAKRQEALSEFKNGNYNILIASDVAGRGIDIENISHVINFDVPTNPEDYVHRIGRTGRAGKKGTAITLVLKKDIKHLQEIEKLIKMKIKIFNVNSEKGKLKDYEFDTLYESNQIPNFLKR